MLVLLVVPIAAFVTLSGVASGAVLAFQNVTGSRVHGVITATGTHTVTAKGPDETYCYGFFQPDDARPLIRVRVYVNGYCIRAKNERALLVRGVASPGDVTVADAETADPGATQGYNGLFGMAEGAVVDHGPFWRGLWPYLFLAPGSVIADLALYHALRSQLRIHRWRRQLEV
jgi:hypothetical protein